MLSHYNEDLSKEVLDMIKEEIRTVLSSKIKLLLEALFSHNEQQWASLLFIQQINHDQRQQFNNIIIKIQQAVFQNGFQNINNYDISQNIKMEDLEEIAKMMLHINELKQEIAKLVGILTTQARKGLDTESDEVNSNNQNGIINMQIKNGGNMNLRQNQQVMIQQKQDLQQLYASGNSNDSTSLQQQRENQKMINNYMRNRL